MSMGSSSKDKVMAPLIVFLGCAFLWGLGAIVAIYDGSPSPKNWISGFTKPRITLEKELLGFIEDGITLLMITKSFIM